MNTYQSPADAIAFMLTRVLDASSQVQALPAFAEVDDDLLLQVLQEAGKFVVDAVAPLNRSGDESGCRFADGVVTTPSGFKQAYQAFWQAGWPAMACAPEDGGQGLPAVLEAALYEMLSGANHGWTMAPGLLHGAYECLKHHGSAALRERYLKKIATGEWLATMCLTEPQAGSDLGLVRTRAVAQSDGSHRLSGTKIFISGGEHDLSENIVHLVLARLPDAPSGPRGLSLFLCPKFLPGGSRNAVHCERIEEKMGLHGSPTCVMRFDEATGWIVGEPGRGLNAMFVMMNSARLHVAMQGIGLLESAWQKADAYSRERRQMRAPVRSESTAAADPIAEHPAMRRILDTQRAWIDGGRVLAYTTALELDIARQHPQAQRRAQAERWCSLVTPVLKSAWTQQAFYGASECLQVFGGHGYVRESGIEQVVRDSRVSMIYEGTNEIQAIDLLVRKVIPDGAAALQALLRQLGVALEPQRRDELALQQQLADLAGLARQLALASAADRELPYWVADDFLRAVALTLLAWAWSQIERALVDDEVPDALRWSRPAGALRHWIGPEYAMRAGIIASRLAQAGVTPA